jgi:hypothetical protein
LKYIVPQDEIARTVQTVTIFGHILIRNASLESQKAGTTPSSYENISFEGYKRQSAETGGGSGCME